MNPSSSPVREKQEISIWFFCGILMLACGLILGMQGVLEFHHPPTTVLANLNPTFWWGIFLAIVGAFYSVRFRPRSTPKLK
jgi:hypothetical protein